MGGGGSTFEPAPYYYDEQEITQQNETLEKQRQEQEAQLQKQKEASLQRQAESYGAERQAKLNKAQARFGAGGVKIPKSFLTGYESATAGDIGRIRKEENPLAEDPTTSHIYEETGNIGAGMSLLTMPFDGDNWWVQPPRRGRT